MSLLRVVLIAATLLAVVASPVLFRSAASSMAAPSAYAAGGSGADPAGRVYANGNNNDNNGNGNGNNNDNNGNGNGNNNDNNGNGNGNDNNGNGNGNDNNSNGNGNGNGNDNSFSPAAPPPPPAPPAPPSTTATKCFGAGENGNVQLTLDSGTVTITTPPTGLPSQTTITLNRVDRATVPPPPTGSIVDGLVWSINGQTGCNGAAISQTPGDVNLGINFTVAADKSKLQIARLVNGAWVDVTTVPDPSPSNPFISSTIHDLGTYIVYQKP